jgi:hypothetical protein
MYAIYIVDLKISLKKPAKNTKLIVKILEKYPVILDKNKNLPQKEKNKLALKHLKTLEFCDFEIKNLKFSSNICYIYKSL